MSFLLQALVRTTWRTKVVVLFIPILLCGIPLAAVDVDISIPRARSLDSGNPLISQDLLDEITDTIEGELEMALESRLADRLNSYESTVLTRGFTNTGIFTSHASTQFGRYDFDNFSLSIGTLGAFQVPSLDPTTLGNIIGNFDTNPDVLFGVGWQVWAAQFGINLGVFDESLDRFNFKVQFGYLPLRLPLTNRVTFDFTSWNVGALLDYALVEPSPAPVIGWQGLTLSSGFIAAGHDIKLIIQQAELFQEFTPGSGALQDQTLRLAVNPLVTNALDVLTFTIPVEISTGISIAGGVMNLSIGGGGDINFGSSKLIVSARTGLNTEIIGDLSDDIEFTDGSVTISQASREAQAPFFIPKIMAGLSMGIGPVYLSVPFNMYFSLPENLGSGDRTQGVGVGISAGVTIGAKF